MWRKSIGLFLLSIPFALWLGLFSVPMGLLGAALLLGFILLLAACITVGVDLAFP